MNRLVGSQVTMASVKDPLRRRLAVSVLELVFSFSFDLRGSGHLVKKISLSSKHPYGLNRNRRRLAGPKPSHSELLFPAPLLSGKTLVEVSTVFRSHP